MGQIDAPRLGALIAHQWNEFMFFADDSYYTESELENVRFSASIVSRMLKMHTMHSLQPLSAALIETARSAPAAWHRPHCGLASAFEQFIHCELWVCQL